MSLREIPPHIKENVVGHTADRWRLQGEIAELVEVTSASVQQDAWQDRPLRAQTGAEHKPASRSANQVAIGMPTSDSGEHPSSAPVTARKN
ncbi:hypothetical protein MOV08_42615 [Streptomyces yunnanensis]|uniref:Uncharacterized protein n=1 Tax=Streptomyces yunnanensis TaxID=156453 RepID=A0ABY8AKC7_9ACTN|nr:hypothetical protein [Streptomyces yunnanensis]WEB45333.1 hypothetical protein MOV08_42615 [Streptomyces yunnanensis]